MSDLKEQAEELGIKVDGRWSEEKIQGAIDEKLNEDSPSAEDQEEESDNEDAQPDSIKNISGRRHKVYEQIVQPGATYTLTDADKADEHNGKRIENAIASGKLERV